MVDLAPSLLQAVNRATTKPYSTLCSRKELTRICIVGSQPNADESRLATLKKSGMLCESYQRLAQKKGLARGVKIGIPFPYSSVITGKMSFESHA